MENMAGALKMALGILVFVIGLTILFNMASLSKETSRIIISEIDKAKYYDYIVEADEQTIDGNGNRIVTIDEIIPSIYRYSQENFGITIVDKGGNIVARFDLDTETACNNWYKLNPYNKYRFVTEIKKIYTQVNDLAKKIGKNQDVVHPINIITSPSEPNETDNIVIENDKEITDLFKKIYGQETSESVRRDFYCFWIGAAGWTAQRIDSDLSGIDVRFSSTSIGQQVSKEDLSNVGNHIAVFGTDGGLINKFKDSKFTEYLIEIDRNDYEYSEDKDEKLFEFGKIMETIKKEYVYVEN